MPRPSPESPHEDEAPKLDTREYSREAVTFYEVGETEAWIEAPEDIVVHAQDMR